eukprot:10506616-Prorocentrum_lima.AAC.1
MGHLVKYCTHRRYWYSSAWHQSPWSNWQPKQPEEGTSLQLTAINTLADSGVAWQKATSSCAAASSW